MKMNFPLVVLVLIGLLISGCTFTRESPYAMGQLAFFTESVDNGERIFELYTIDLEGKKITSLGRGGTPVWSPDGKRLALASSVVDVENREHAEIQGQAYYGGSYFWGWTPDGRYAIYSSYDQYGNRDSTIFDVWDWKTVIMSTSIRCYTPHSMSPECLQSVVATSPTSSYLLLGDGTILHLPDFITQTKVISYGGVSAAAWSHNEKYLSFVNFSYPSSGGCALHVAEGNGEKVQRIVETDCELSRLTWDTNSQVTTSCGRYRKYIFDVTTAPAQVMVSGLAENELCHPYSRSCGEVKYFFDEETELGEISSACWSPDEVLLAVGRQNELSIYSDKLNLMQTFPMSGTVKSIRWSPIP